MKKNETYYGAYRLYILRPSKIIDVEGKFSKEKNRRSSKEVDIVKQNVVFRTIPDQIVIAEKSAHNKYLYTLVIGGQQAHKGRSTVSLRSDKNYYDQKTLEKQGVFLSPEPACYVGLFPNDIISLLDLPDFEFIQNLGQIGLIKKLKYFKGKNKLKTQYHRELDKIQYTKEELEELKQYLIENVFMEEKPREIQKNYKVVKQQNELHLHLGTLLPSRPPYAGTSEDIDKQFQKSLKSNGKEFRI